MGEKNPASSIMVNTTMTSTADQGVELVFPSLGSSYTSKEEEEETEEEESSTSNEDNVLDFLAGFLGGEEEEEASSQMQESTSESVTDGTREDEDEDDQSSTMSNSSNSSHWKEDRPTKTSPTSSSSDGSTREEEDIEFLAGFLKECEEQPEPPPSHEEEEIEVELEQRQQSSSLASSASFRGGSSSRDDHSITSHTSTTMSDESPDAIDQNTFLALQEMIFNYENHKKEEDGASETSELLQEEDQEDIQELKLLLADSSSAADSDTESSINSSSHKPSACPDLLLYQQEAETTAMVISSSDDTHADTNSRHHGDETQQEQPPSEITEFEEVEQSLQALVVSADKSSSFDLNFLDALCRSRSSDNHSGSLALPPSWSGEGQLVVRSASKDSGDIVSFQLSFLEQQLTCTEGGDDDDCPSVEEEDEADGEYTGDFLALQAMIAEYENEQQQPEGTDDQNAIVDYPYDETPDLSVTSTTTTAVWEHKTIPDTTASSTIPTLLLQMDPSQSMEDIAQQHDPTTDGSTSTAIICLDSSEDRVSEIQSQDSSSSQLDEEEMRVMVLQKMVAAYEEQQQNNRIDETPSKDTTSSEYDDEELRVMALQKMIAAYEEGQREQQERGGDADCDIPCGRDDIASSTIEPDDAFCTALAELAKVAGLDDMGTPSLKGDSHFAQQEPDTSHCRKPRASVPSAPTIGEAMKPADCYSAKSLPVLSEGSGSRHSGALVASRKSQLESRLAPKASSDNHSPSNSNDIQKSKSEEEFLFLEAMISTYMEQQDNRAEQETTESGKKISLLSSPRETKEGLIAESESGEDITTKKRKGSDASLSVDTQSSHPETTSDETVTEDTETLNQSDTEDEDVLTLKAMIAEYEKESDIAEDSPDDHEQAAGGNISASSGLTRGADMELPDNNASGDGAAGRGVSVITSLKEPRAKDLSEPTRATPTVCVEDNINAEIASPLAKEESEAMDEIASHVIPDEEPCFGACGGSGSECDPYQLVQHNVLASDPALTATQAVKSPPRVARRSAVTNGEEEDRTYSESKGGPIYSPTPAARTPFDIATLSAAEKNWLLIRELRYVQLQGSDMFDAITDKIESWRHHESKAQYQQPQKRQLRQRSRNDTSNPIICDEEKYLVKETRSPLAKAGAKNLIRELAYVQTQGPDIADSIQHKVRSWQRQESERELSKESTTSTAENAKQTLFGVEQGVRKSDFKTEGLATLDEKSKCRQEKLLTSENTEITHWGSSTCSKSYSVTSYSSSPGAGCDARSRRVFVAPTGVLSPIESGAGSSFDWDTSPEMAGIVSEPICSSEDESDEEVTIEITVHSFYDTLASDEEEWTVLTIDGQAGVYEFFDFDHIDNEGDDVYGVVGRGVSDNISTISDLSFPTVVSSPPKESSAAPAVIVLPASPRSRSKASAKASRIRSAQRRLRKVATSPRKSPSRRRLPFQNVKLRRAQSNPARLPEMRHAARLLLLKEQLNSVDHPEGEQARSLRRCYSDKPVSEETFGHGNDQKRHKTPAVSKCILDFSWDELEQLEDNEERMDHDGFSDKLTWKLQIENDTSTSREIKVFTPDSALTPPPPPVQFGATQIGKKDDFYQSVSVSFLAQSIQDSVIAKVMDEALRILRSGGVLNVLDINGAAIERIQQNARYHSLNFRKATEEDQQRVDTNTLSILEKSGLKTKFSVADPRITHWAATKTEHLYPAINQCLTKAIKEDCLDLIFGTKEGIPVQF